MSDEDRLRWKGKLVGMRTKRFQVEIRRNGLVLILGGAQGYKYKHYDNATPFSVHLALNGPQVLTAKQWSELDEATQEAWTLLGFLEFAKPEWQQNIAQSLRLGRDPIHGLPNCGKYLFKVRQERK